MSDEQRDEQANEPEERDERIDAVGAYLLDALTDEERAELDAYLAESEDGRQEARELAPVVSLLPLLLDAELANDPSLAKIQPSAGLRTRVLDAIRAEQSAPAIETPIVEEPVIEEPVVEEPVAEESVAAEMADAPPDVAPTRPEPVSISAARPQGRIRGGTTSTASSSPIEIIRKMGPAWLAAAVLGIVAIGAVIWALALQGTINDKNREITALQNQTNASAWQLAPSEGGQATGTVLYSQQAKAAALVVQNLPELPSDKVYQLWYIRGDNNPEPGGTFAVDAQGSGAATVADDVATYDVVALTEEPAGGSTTPSMPILLSGQVSSAVGAIPGSGIAAFALVPPDGLAPR